MRVEVDGVGGWVQLAMLVGIVLLWGWHMFRMGVDDGRFRERMDLIDRRIELLRRAERERDEP